MVEWGSETVVIPYENPLDKKIHRYIVDAVIKLKTPTGIKKYLVEVKPSKQINKPVEAPGKHKKTLLYEQLTYIQNQAKWQAAKELCKNRGLEFVLLSEKELRK